MLVQAQIPLVFYQSSGTTHEKSETKEGSEKYTKEHLISHKEWSGQTTLSL